jgi:hypothetical protein
MKKIIRLTEEDLHNIVKRVIKEQGILGLARPTVRTGINLSKSVPSGKPMPSPQDGVDAVDVRDLPMCQDKDYSQIVSELFTHISKTPTHSIRTPKKGETYSKLSSDYYLINYMEKLKSLMEGIGNNEGVLNIFSKLTLKDFSTIINNWKKYTGSNQSLYEWLEGEWGISWKEVWDSIGSFKNKFNISKMNCRTETLYT